MDDVLSGHFVGEIDWMWAIFLGIVFALVTLDLCVFNRRDKEIGIKQSLSLYSFYVSVALMFGLWVWFDMGRESALEFYTAYIVEASLSMDNLFVMAVIFGALKIPRKYQHRVLFWGIMGVVVMRGLMIGLGSVLVHEFEWVLYIFGAFLAATGVKILFLKEQEADEHEGSVRNSAPVKFLKKTFRVTDKLHGHDFFVRLPISKKKNAPKALHMTPLFLALVAVELADVVFAVDSVPAVFAITTNTFIVYTSNIFAILGLRSLYFALSALMERFVYLKYSIGAVLIFIGFKVLVPLFTTIEKVPAEISLSVTIGLLGAGVIASLLKTARPKRAK